MPEAHGSEADRWTPFASYCGKEQPAYSRLIFGNDVSLTDCAGKGLVHRALQLGSEPPIPQPRK